MSHHGQKNSLCGRVRRIASEPKRAVRGGYQFRGLEIETQAHSGRVFIMCPEFAGQDVYEFPLLCWEGALIRAENIRFNNSLANGAIIYTASPDSVFVLEPFRPVSVTEAVQAVTCIRAVDVLFRLGTEEPFWMAKGNLIHELFAYLLESRADEQCPTFEEGFLRALPALMAVMPGSRVLAEMRQLRKEAETHFHNLLRWLKQEGAQLGHSEVEVERVCVMRGLRGRADAIFHGQTGTVILELKSGRFPVESHLLQLCAYATLFTAEEDPSTVDGQILYSASGTTAFLERPSIEQKKAILWARNRVVSLKHSYNESPISLKNHTCNKQRRCFFRNGCLRLFGDTAMGRRPVLTGLALEYYQQWFRRISQDAWAEEEEYARMLNPETLSQRLKEGVTLAGTVREFTGEISPLPSEGIRERGRAVSNFLEFLPLEHPADMTVGEEVVLHRGDPCGKEAVMGRVVHATERGVCVRRASVFASARHKQVSTGQWFLDRIPFSRGRDASRRALLRFLLKGNPAVVGIVIGKRDLPSRTATRNQCGETNTQSNRSNVRVRRSTHELLVSENRTEKLNEDQEAAVNAALESDTYHIIYGPPGTGKTCVLAKLIRLCLSRGEQLLVVCPTNVALDRLLLALVDLGVKDMVRIGTVQSASSEFASAATGRGYHSIFLEELARSCHDVRTFVNRVRHASVIGATAYQVAAHPIFLRLRFDRVIVDEAGQLDEPATLGALAVAERFVLGGDHLQLPPVVKAGVDDPGGGGSHLQISLLERLFLSAPPERISRLRMQYRMNREIQELPSQLFYDGLLFPAPEVAERRLKIAFGLSREPGLGKALDPDIPVVFVDVRGTNREKACPEEAAVACRIVKTLVAFGVQPNDIGIITPYRAQQALIRRHLQESNEDFQGITVDTVDRFQGGEREVIILSLARSDEVTSFLADRKRLNVSLSRARSKLILLGHGPVLEEHPLFASLLTGLERIPAC